MAVLSNSAALLIGLLASALVYQVTAEGGTAKPVTDVRFVLPADQAILSAGQLILNGTSTSVQYFKKGDKIGVLPTADFANTSAKSRFVTGNGTWLAAPSAVLMGTDGNTIRAVLLSLGNPTYDSVSKTMVFAQVTVLPLNASHLPVSTGSTVEILAEAGQGTPTPLVRDVANGTVWREAALFIDHAEGSTLSKASTEGVLGLLLVGAAVAGVAAVGASAGAAAGAASSNRGGGTTVVNNYGGK